MSEIVETHNFREEEFDYSRLAQIYNGLDCCVTHEIYQRLKKDIDNDFHAKLSYDFVRAMQAPALEIMLRGIKIDMAERARMISQFEEELEDCKDLMNLCIKPLLGWSKDTRGWRLNPNSPQKLKFFFYGVLGCKERFTFNKGERTLTANREALEKIRDEDSDEACFFANIVLDVRDLTKKLGALRSGVDFDGRMRFGIKVTGTETGRWSSTKNIFGRGMNSQNLTNRLRRIFIADKGKKFAYCDLSSAESRIVAYLANDQAYIDANEGPLKLHAAVAQMVWPEANWPAGPEGILKKSKEKFYRDFSRYDLAKRGAHGSTYLGKAKTMARHLKVALRVLQNFQKRFFSAFPGIAVWQDETIRNLQLNGYLITPLGRKRIFMGRRDDPSTHREGIAYLPQSTVGELLNLGLWRVWADLRIRNSHKLRSLGVEVLLQLHDAILIQYPEENEKKVLDVVLPLMEIPIIIGEREVTIPVEAKVGWNAEEVEEPEDKKRNPDGLLVWTGEDQRRRKIPATLQLKDIRL